MIDETPEEFKKRLKKSFDELVNFQPPKPTRQTRAKTRVRGKAIGVGNFSKKFSKYKIKKGLDHI
tara:strand:+ start:232 stop:426 length:195 start_codon:yes stop_codon:yes gene_type:complete